MRVCMLEQGRMSVPSRAGGRPESSSESGQTTCPAEETLNNVRIRAIGQVTVAVKVTTRPVSPFNIRLIMRR